MQADTPSVLSFSQRCLAWTLSAIVWIAMAWAALQIGVAASLPEPPAIAGERLRAEISAAPPVAALTEAIEARPLEAAQAPFLPPDPAPANPSTPVVPAPRPEVASPTPSTAAPASPAIASASPGIAGSAPSATGPAAADAASGEGTRDGPPQGNGRLPPRTLAILRARQCLALDPRDRPSDCPPNDELRRLVQEAGAPRYRPENAEAFSRNELAWRGVPPPCLDDGENAKFTGTQVCVRVGTTPSRVRDWRQICEELDLGGCTRPDQAAVEAAVRQALSQQPKR